MFLFSNIKNKDPIIYSYFLNNGDLEIKKFNFMANFIIKNELFNWNLFINIWN
jgi:hypothetical protein